MKITVTIKCTAETKDEATHKLAVDYPKFRAYVEQMTQQGVWGLPPANVTLRWLIETGVWSREGTGGSSFVPPGSASVDPGPEQREVGPMPPLPNTKESSMIENGVPTQPKYEFISGVLGHPGGVAQACAQLQGQGFDIFAILPVSFQDSPLAPNVTHGICVVGRREAQPVVQTSGFIQTIDVPPSSPTPSDSLASDGSGVDGNR